MLQPVALNSSPDINKHAQSSTCFKSSPPMLALTPLSMSRESAYAPTSIFFRSRHSCAQEFTSEHQRGCSVHLDARSDTNKSAHGSCQSHTKDVSLYRHPQCSLRQQRGPRVLRVVALHALSDNTSVPRATRASSRHPRPSPRHQRSRPMLNVLRSYALDACSNPASSPSLPVPVNPERTAQSGKAANQRSAPL